MTPHDDYLWDPEGATPDDDVARLVSALRPLRYTSGPRPIARRRTKWWVAAVGVAAVAVFGALIWPTPTSDNPTTPDGWVVQVEGAEAGRLAVGAWLDTERAEWTDVEVADLGRVSVAPKSKLRLLRTGKHEHRMELRRGTVRAVINAPPRLFIVETPSAVAVDLGCSYELHVNDDGSGRLKVETGIVALERPDRIVRVPMGFSCSMCSSGGGSTLTCSTHTEGGIGIPVQDHAAKAHRDAIARYETGDDSALADALKTATEYETVTLYHLLPLVAPGQRGEVLDRLQKFAPLPKGVTRKGLLSLRANELERYWHEAINLMW